MGLVTVTYSTYLQPLLWSRFLLCLGCQCYKYWLDHRSVVEWFGRNLWKVALFHRWIWLFLGRNRMRQPLLVLVAASLTMGVLWRIQVFLAVVLGVGLTFPLIFLRYLIVGLELWLWSYFRFRGNSPFPVCFFHFLPIHCNWRNSWELVRHIYS